MNNRWIFSFAIQLSKEAVDWLTYYLVHYSGLYHSEITIIYETLINFKAPLGFRPSIKLYKKKQLVTLQFQNFVFKLIKRFISILKRW